MDGNTRICKKCLLREMDEAGFFQNMYDYIVRAYFDICSQAKRMEVFYLKKYMEEV